MKHSIVRKTVTLAAIPAAMAVLLCLAMLMTREEGTSFIYFQF